MPIAALVLTDGVAVVEAMFDMVSNENILPFVIAGILTGLTITFLKRGFRFGRG